MAEEQRQTILSEIKSRKIRPVYFDELYRQLNEGQRLPPGDVVPWGQYVRIVGYLRGAQVLKGDNNVDPENLRLFDARRKLEATLAQEDKSEHEEPREFRLSGGVMPCRREHRSSGGIVSCR